MSDAQTPADASAPPPPRAESAAEDWSALAASLAPDARRRSARDAAAATPQPAGGHQRSLLASSLALVLALAAITVAGMLWWQYRQFYVSLDQTDNAAALALERVRAEQRALQDDLKDAKDDVDTLRQLNSSLSDRVDALPSRFVDVERRLDAVQGGSFDARADLLRSEAEYYLGVANTELALAGDWDNAVKALELADGRLAELADPKLGPVRESIAGEILTLRGVRLPDIEGLVFSLGRLAGRAAELPMRADPPTNFANGAKSLDEAEPGIGRLWLALKRTLLGLVRVERRDEPVAQALSAAERLVSRRRLEVELELARVAVLRVQPQVLQSSLTSAIDLLRRDFDADSAEVEGALTFLNEMREVDIQPRRPDISGSLNQLRELEAGGKN